MESKKEHDVEYADPEEEEKRALGQAVYIMTLILQTVDIPEVAKVTGEEEEECIFKMRSKLFRKRDEQLKERGIGNAKLMRHKENKKIRFVMRQEKTFKPVANFLGK